MNINKININQTEPTYYIASDIYDVSAHNNGATFESLSALLSSENLSTLIPTAVRCGGMTIRFVQSSDNKYVQARCMAQNFTTDVTQWQGVDDEPTAESDNLVKSGAVKSSLNEIVYKEKSANFNVTAGSLTLIFELINHPLTEGQVVKFIIKTGTATITKGALGAFNPNDGSWLMLTESLPTNELHYAIISNNVTKFGVWIAGEDITGSGSAVLETTVISPEFKLYKNIHPYQIQLSNANVPEYSVIHYQDGTPDNIRNNVYYLNVYVEDEFYTPNMSMTLRYLGKYAQNNMTYIQIGEYIDYSYIPNSDIDFIDINTGIYKIVGLINWRRLGAYTWCKATIDILPMSTYYRLSIQEKNNISNEISVDSKHATIDVSSGNRYFNFNVFTNINIKKGDLLRIKVGTSNAISNNADIAIYGFGPTGTWNCINAINYGDSKNKYVEIYSLNDAVSLGLIIESENITNNDTIDIDCQFNWNKSWQWWSNQLNSKYSRKGQDLREVSLLTNTYPQYIKETAGLTKIFKDWCFIGDSLSSGFVPLSKDTSIAQDNIFASWTHQMCRLCGVEGVNLSYAGCTTNSWIASFANDSSFTEDKKQAYIIALGTNDANNNKTIGSISDIKEDYHNNEDTFYGNYGGIIQRIKEIQPSARIFIIATPNWWSNMEYKGYNAAIREMSTYFNKVYLIDLYNAYNITSQISNYLVYGHMNTVGYLWCCYAVCTYIDWIISNNISAFADVVYIGTNIDDGDI